ARLRGAQGRATVGACRLERWGADRRGGGPIRRYRDTCVTDRGEGGGWGDTGRGYGARVVQRQGVLVRGPGGVCGQGIRGAGPRVGGEACRRLRRQRTAARPEARFSS